MSGTPSLEETDTQHRYSTPAGTIETYEIGQQLPEVKQQYDAVKTQLDHGVFHTYIDTAAEHAEQNSYVDGVPEHIRQHIDSIIAGITDYGRGIAEVTCTQLLVKTLQPDLNIRLHKGNRNSDQFSWKRGFSLRGVGEDIGKILTNRHLLRTNNDGGGVMTRQLAQNEPYTPLYGRSLKGPRDDWVSLVEALEAGDFDPEPALVYFLTQLHHHRRIHADSVDDCLDVIDERIPTNCRLDTAYTIIRDHIQRAPCAASLLEVAPHALLQALVDDEDVRFDGELVRLTPRTAANRKAGSIADIHVRQPTGDAIWDAWDAKYDRTITEGDVDSLEEKLDMHLDTDEYRHLGFLTLGRPEITSDAQDRLDESDYEIVAHSLEDFVSMYRPVTPLAGEDWLTVYIEVLGRRRLGRAKMNEDATKWLDVFKDLVTDRFSVTEQKQMDDFL